jgi:integrase
MSPLHDRLVEYLRIRRALGYKLERAEKLLLQYLEYLDALGAETVTIQNSVAWATLPAVGKDGHWWAFRLSVPSRAHRAIPYLYSQEEILALMAATSALHGELRQASYRTLIGLLSVTGMRVGEAIRLDRHDLDLRHGVLTVRGTKFGKSRELPVHASTVDALRSYLRRRDRLCPEPVTDAALISLAGTRLLYTNVHSTFRELRRRAGLAARSAACRPRIHDVRHTFAVCTLLGWYRAGVEVQPRLPLLSTYLGHYAGDPVKVRERRRGVRCRVQAARRRPPGVRMRPVWMNAVWTRQALSRVRERLSRSMIAAAARSESRRWVSRWLMIARASRARSVGVSS